MIREIEIQIESREVYADLFLHTIDMEGREKHTPFRVIGVR